MWLKPLFARISKNAKSGLRKLLEVLPIICTYVTGYYMTWVDYCFEGLIPMFCGLVVSATFQLFPVAVISTIMLNVVPASTVHSEWYIPGLPDPGNHWLHHSKV
jgi:sterol desaturase/sphingolipid hydroxylase (fatty acid hydroxylase superfamily)